MAIRLGCNESPLDQDQRARILQGLAQTGPPEPETMEKVIDAVLPML